MLDNGPQTLQRSCIADISSLKSCTSIKPRCNLKHFQLVLKSLLRNQEASFHRDKATAASCKLKIHRGRHWTNRGTNCDPSCCWRDSGQFDPDWTTFPHPKERKENGTDGFGRTLVKRCGDGESHGALWAQLAVTDLTGHLWMWHTEVSSSFFEHFQWTCEINRSVSSHDVLSENMKLRKNHTRITLSGSVRTHCYIFAYQHCAQVENFPNHQLQIHQRAVVGGLQGGGEAREKVKQMLETDSVRMFLI